MCTNVNLFRYPATEFDISCLEYKLNCFRSVIANRWYYLRYEVVYVLPWPTISRRLYIFLVKPVGIERELAAFVRFESECVMRFWKWLSPSLAATRCDQRTHFGARFCRAPFFRRENPLLFHSGNVTHAEAFTPSGSILAEVIAVLPHFLPRSLHSVKKGEFYAS